MFITNKEITTKEVSPDDLMEAALLNSDVVYGKAYDFMIPNPNWQYSYETNRANVEKSFEVRFIA